MPRVVFDETNDSENIESGSLDAIRRPRRKAAKIRQAEQLPPVPVSAPKGRRDFAETYRLRDFSTIFISCLQQKR